MKISELITGLRHIGIVVENIHVAVQMYTKIFDIDDTTIQYVPPIEEPAPDTRFAFVPIGNTELELIEPISEWFKQFLGNPRPGINHIAFTVTNIDAAVALMQAKGVRLGHVTRDGILDMKRSRVAYFNPEDTGGILIEFVQPGEKPS
ncbi:MAG: VOC family protein [Desulfobacterota bacterium]|nr:VOC family protein [Thermodesulfobacteriota bacterium]